MDYEQKANELGFKFFPDEENIWARANVEATKCAFACLEMAQWKDEQLSKCLKNLEKEYIRNSGKGLYDNNEIAAKLATLKRIEEEMKGGEK